MNIVKQIYDNAIYQEGEYPLLKVRIDNAGYLIVPYGTYDERNGNFNTIYQVEFLGEKYLFTQRVCNKAVNKMVRMFAMLLMNQEWEDELVETFTKINGEVLNQIES